VDAATTPGRWNCSQNDPGSVLLRGARELGGGLRYFHPMESFEQDPEGVTAGVHDRSSGRLRTVRGDYLVAADGRRSPVRTAGRHGRCSMPATVPTRCPLTWAAGSNTGIQDAPDLAWKPATVLSGWARTRAAGELRSRAPALATGTRAAARSVEHSHPGSSLATGAGLDGTRSGMPDVTLRHRSPPGRRHGCGSGRPVASARMRLIGGPGSRAPHLWLRRAGARLPTLDPHERSMVQTRR
jgi:2-polyprenyl-6-methoxyphenol hydroxylase-like FAD-dependent oxidoreductase